MPFSNIAVFSQGALLFAYPRLSLGCGGLCGPGIFLGCVTGKEAYFSLQKAERTTKELEELHTGGVGGLQASEQDLTLASGR